MTMAFVTGLVAMLAGATPVLPDKLTSTTLTIACGETKRLSPGGHVLAVQFLCSANAGDVLSFESDVQGGGYYLTVHDELAQSNTNGEARICGWVAPATGEYTVGLYGAADQEYTLWLTMYCGPLPEACSVPVSPSSWARVKALFR